MLSMDEMLSTSRATGTYAFSVNAVVMVVLSAASGDMTVSGRAPIGSNPRAIASVISMIGACQSPCKLC